ncbi:MAG: Gfo/Idh/MocA family protein, partial [Dehalococcoidia bacterium]
HRQGAPVAYPALHPGAEPYMVAKSMRFLIAGLGSIGERHFQNLRGLGFQEIAVYRTTDRAPRTLNGAEFPIFRSLEEALDRRPDVVLVTNPTHLHVPVALEAARRGIHLFIDIPLSHSLEGTEELVQLSQEQGLVTLMGFNLRFHPCLRKLRELVQQGAVGRVIAVQAECASYLPDWHPWENYREGYAARRDMGGGAILAAGVHELDYLLWTFGPVEELLCMAEHRSRLELKGVEDTASLTLRFRNGVVGELHCDLVERPYSRWCKVIGEEGTIFWDFLENQVRLYHPGQKRWEVVLDQHGFDYNTTYVEELWHLVRCLAGEEQTLNDIWQGREVLRIALAAQQAAQEGRCCRIEE